MAALHGRCGAARDSALCLAARGAQLLWCWRNKRAFVSKMMSEQQAAAPEEGGDSAVSVAWRQGMSCVLRSPSRFSRTLGASQPWFVVVEDEARESSPFDSFGRKVPEGGAPLYWHFMSHASSCGSAASATEAASGRRSLKSFSARAAAMRLCAASCSRSAFRSCSTRTTRSSTCSGRSSARACSR